MITIPFNDLKAQYAAIKKEVDERINAVLQHGQYIMGPEVAVLENELAKYTNTKYCITVASGTEALFISLMALNIKPGDEVITSSFTFAATGEVIALLGATPIFVDINPNTCNINPKLIEAAVSPKTKAIIPVSLFGQPADMDEINDIACRHGGIPVIEDAAQSFGSEYKGKKSCNLSTIGCTSFFPSKPLGCYGDGGAIFTNNSDIAQACKEIRVHGQRERYKHTRIGVGGRMDTLQCAILLAKLTRFKWEVTKRIQIGEKYNQLFDEAKINRILQTTNRTSVFGQYSIFVEKREFIQEQLARQGIPTAIHYPTPLNEQEAYKYLNQEGNTPIAKSISKRVMSIPFGPDMTDAQQLTVVEKIKHAISA